jgi:hypothetical protein
MTSQVFHGLGFYWARHCGLFDLPDVAPLPSRNDTTNLVYEAWRGWIARESQLRSLLGMYILDGVISQYSGNPTFAQHMANQLPMPSDELAFSAISASEWLERQLQLDTYQSSLRFCDVFRVFFYPEEKLDNSRPPDLTFLALKVILEGLKSLVAESSRVEPHPVGVPSPEEINVVLDRIRGYIIAHSGLTLLERQTAMLRWHAICLDTWKVAARGARRLCFSHGITQHIFGGCERYETDIDPQRHIDKEDARRTLLHAREIQHIASQLPLGLAHDPHVPGAVFAAATTYAAFALAGKSRILFPITVDWNVAVVSPSSHIDLEIDEYETFTSGLNPTAAFIRGTLETAGVSNNAVTVDISYEMSTIRLLLRGLSLQWGVCLEMEEVVDAWISKCIRTGQLTIPISGIFAY